MRVVVDVLGAPESSGGMRLYAEELLRAWIALDTGDQLHVVGNDWVRCAFEGQPGLTIHAVPEGARFRIPGQWLYTPWLVRRLRADGLVSVSMVASPLAGRPRVCVVHDWRHLKHAREFSRWQRLYRRSWVWSVNRADAAIQISSKTDEETARIAPRARRAIVENGRDHPRRWPVVERVLDGQKRIVTFGHHSNKRPELVIESLSHLAGEDAQARLVVLGAKGEYADSLGVQAELLGLRDRVEFPGFVSAEDYQAVMQTADVVVLASTDEGFGLPVPEANYFGVPVVSTSDNGVDHIHPGRTIVAAPNARFLASAISAGLRKPLRAARFSEGGAWADAAYGVRELVRVEGVAR